MTTIRLSGPCDVVRIVAETLQVSVTNTLRIPLPISCQLRIPIGVTLEARDAALQRTTRTLATQLSITDRTPPKVTWGAQDRRASRAVTSWSTRSMPK
jgi:hypothetical protein